MNQNYLLGRIAKIALAVCLTATAVFGGLAIADGTRVHAATEIWAGDMTEFCDDRGCYFYGDGTSQYPFLISNGADLARLAMVVNTGYDNERYNNNDVHYKMDGDVWLNDTTYWCDALNFTQTQGLNNWIPIGDWNDPFRGNFNGDGFSIYGVRVQIGNGEGGLFARTNGARIENLNVRKSSIRTSCSGHSVAGGIIANSVDSFLINVTFSGHVLGEGWSGGGLAGGLVAIKSGGYILNSLSLGIVRGASGTMGGLVGVVGWDSPGFTIKNSFFYAPNFIESPGIIGDSGGQQLNLYNVFGFDEDFRLKSWVYELYYCEHCCGLTEWYTWQYVYDGRDLVEVANEWVAANRDDWDLQEWRIYDGRAVIGEPRTQTSPDDDDIWNGVEVETSDNRNDITWVWVLLGVFGFGAIASGVVWIFVARRKTVSINLKS